MDTINESSNTDKKRYSHGVPREGLGVQAPQNTHHGSPLKGETIVYVSQARSPYGSFQEPIPNIIEGFQKEPRLGQKKVYEKIVDEDEEYIKKIKRPILYADPENCQPDPICQEADVPTKTNCCSCWPRWVW